MKHALPGEIDLGSVEDAVGPDAYAAGLRALGQRAVLEVVWQPWDRVLRGYIHASDGEFLETAVYLTEDQPAGFSEGRCSCRQRRNCEHAAALALAAAQASGQALAARGAAQPDAAWQRSLAALLAPERQDSRLGSLEHTVIAVELTLADVAAAYGRTQAYARSQAYGRSQPAGRDPAAGPRMLALNARLVQAGKKGGWVAGQLSWGKLDSLQYYGDFPDSHLRLLKELYWTYLSGSRATGYFSYDYSGCDQRYIDLAKFESRQLWPLLDEADSVGLPLVHGRKLGAVGRYVTAEVCLDVTGSDRPGQLLISPVIRVNGRDAEARPVRFIGSDGHGMVYVDGAEAERAESEQGAEPGSWRFGLARLTKPAPARLQQLALAGEKLTVPAAERDRFCDEYYPRLRLLAPVISSDESFDPPVISAPTLVLGAAYGSGHSVDVSWEWLYQVGESQLRAPLTAGPDDPGYRDVAAERTILASLEAVPLDRFGLAGVDPAAAGPGSAARLTGIDTMLFSTELLPLLAGQPGVEIETRGERADYREASDSVSIGVSADAVAGENDWFDLGVSITVEGRSVPFTEVFLALSRGESHLLLADGAYFSLDKPELQVLARLIEEARALQDSPAGPLRISRFQAGLWGELAELGVISHQASTWQRQVEGLLSVDGIDRTEPPATLTAQLRPYQLDGFQWLAFLWEHQLGGILADDMGLGKTLQALALISHARQAQADAPPFLIVAPTSVVPNWATEAARFAPGLKVAVITDTMARRGQALGEIIAGADAVVTTYTLLRIDFASYAGAEWGGLILDEAQSAKNHQSKTYQCARRLAAPFKLAITGTPMENNLMELWSLLSITAPGLFPSPERFCDYYVRPIEKQGQTELLGQLRRRIKPLVKRRTKEQVAGDLPAKQEQVLEVELHPRHRKLYQTHLQRERQKVLGLIGDMNANRFTILRSLTLLRQLSLHAGLVDCDHEDVPSSKIDALLEQLGEVVGGGHRALVFSQFTRFLARVRWRLDAAGIEYCYLDGKTRDRAAVLRQFKDGQAPVFLISLKAGGFGLNLTEADYCFLLDPWWNPATEAQAVDRTHRIGQTRNVMVYRLIAAGTIEEKVMALKARKSELFASVMDSGNAFGGGLDADDIRGLLA